MKILFSAILFALVIINVNAQTVTVYHYTNKAGYNAIKSQNPYKFKASTPLKGHPKGVYLTTKSPEILNKSANGYKKLGLTKDKSTYFFEFEIDSKKLNSIKGDRGKFIKYVKGDLEVDRDDTTRKGLTPKK